MASLTLTIFGEDRSASDALDDLGASADDASGKLAGLAAGAEGMRGLKETLVGAAGAFAIGGAIKSTTDEFKELTGSVQAMQQVTGGSTEAASRLVSSLQMAGVDGEMATDTMREFGIILTEAAADTESAAAMQDLLGRSFTDASGKILPLTELLPAVADKLAAMPDGADKTAVALSILGEEGAGLLPFLSQGSAGLADLAAKSDAMGLTMTSGAVASMNKAVSQSQQLDATFSGLKVQIGQALLPILTQLAGFLMTVVVPAVQGVSQWVSENSTFVGIAAVSVAGFWAAWQGYKILSAVTGAVELLNTAMKANPILFIVGLIALLVAAFITLWNKSEAFRNFWIGIWDAIKLVVTTIVDAIKAALSAAWDFIKKAAEVAWTAIKAVILAPMELTWAALSAIWNGAGSFFSGIWEGIKSGASAAWGLIKSYIVDPIQGAWDFLKTTFTTIVTWVSDKWGGLANTISSVWTGAGAVITGIWDGIRTGVKAAANLVIDAINLAISGINKVISGVNWVADWLPGVGSSMIPAIPSIPRLRQGGMFPGLALVGEGGPEILVGGAGGQVLPNRDARSLLDGGLGGDTIQITIQSGVLLGTPEQLGVAVADAIAAARRTGRIPAGKKI